MNNATDEDYLRQEAQNDLRGGGSYTNGAGEFVKYEPATGCWIDGHWGHYGIARLVDIAQDNGFEISDLDESAVWAYRNNIENFYDEQTGEFHNAFEWTLAVSEDAEEWLNEHIARPGFYFGWHDGEFFYMATGWWSEDDDHIVRGDW